MFYICYNIKKIGCRLYSDTSSDCEDFIIYELRDYQYFVCMSNGKCCELRYKIINLQNYSCNPSWKTFAYP